MPFRLANIPTTATAKLEVVKGKRKLPFLLHSSIATTAWQQQPMPERVVTLPTCATCRNSCACRRSSRSSSSSGSGSRSSPYSGPCCCGARTCACGSTGTSGSGCACGCRSRSSRCASTSSGAARASPARRPRHASNRRPFSSCASRCRCRRPLNPHGGRNHDGRSTACCSTGAAGRTQLV